MKPTFDARIITPSQVEKIEKISFFRGEDASGSFGLLPRHTEFLTILEPAIAIAVIDGNEEYFAFNGGILTFKKNALTITTKEFVRSGDVGELRERIERAFRQQREQESHFHMNMANLEKAFFKRLIELERDFG
jgi:F-type H+-transporting ATPase subunit epsilon